MNKNISYNGFAISGVTNYKSIVKIGRFLNKFKSIKLSEYSINFIEDKVDYTIRFYPIKELPKEMKSFSRKFNINVSSLCGN